MLVFKLLTAFIALHLVAAQTFNDRKNARGRMLQTRSQREVRASSDPDDSPAAWALVSPVGNFAKLVPLPFNYSWSTAPIAPEPGPLLLSDANLRPNNLTAVVPHVYANATDGILSLVASYNKGSYNAGTSSNVTTAKEIVFGYTVLFQSGFNFAHGGKLPGFYTGDSGLNGIDCKGTNRGNSCMSLRFMWDAKGLGFAEALVPTTESPNLQACMTATQLVNCTSAIPQGWPLASDSFTWSTGTPMSVSMRIRLNDPKIANGEMQYWVNGVSMADVQGLVLRDTAASRFRGMHMQTYFGGDTSYYAFPKNQKASFRDFTVAITEQL